MISQLSQAKQWFAANEKLGFWIKAFVGANLIALFAQISIPLPYVPITGQTLAVLVVGLALGSKAGATAAAIYLLEGAMGLPVFAGGAGGFARILGASGGYLLSYVPAMFLLGYFSDKGALESLWKTALAALLASVVIYAFGLIQLSFFLPAGKSVLAVGLYPFIAGDLLKAALASVLVVPTHRLFSKL
ncbi:biotin transport system substrate-specific component [Nicoletella semolina]|uniref:Biotin transporter n=1 Tax=Nicoletella semolina TaxID=271160 RepID=A0A4R2NCD6_9PAST|nr:biotin transporter BioY [Nicoletella semolina]MDH2924303.1 biotin transporter BioY [Nicoletella semolina]TCP18797.1 biotin transport system substrate-specific component [Nicoletella semolina]